MKIAITAWNMPKTLKRNCLLLVPPDDCSSYCSCQISETISTYIRSQLCWLHSCIKYDSNPQAQEKQIFDPLVSKPTKFKHGSSSYCNLLHIRDNLGSHARDMLPSAMVTLRVGASMHKNLMHDW